MNSNGGTVCGSSNPRIVIVVGFGCGTLWVHWDTGTGDTRTGAAAARVSGLPTRVLSEF